ncbi:MAG: peptidylprolyl isomerase [Bacteroidota bacterium]
MQKSKNNLYLIKTSLGNIKIKLYEETPLHTRNFDSLVRSGYYDGLLFHRVISQFMIQTGDPKSKDSTPGTPLGNGGPGYTIPAEIHPHLFHKKGAISAARLGDQMNPQKASSGSQFYIVVGQTYTEGALKKLESQIQQNQYQTILNNKIISLRDEISLEDKEVSYEEILQMAKSHADSIISKDSFHFTHEQINAYSTIGGTPHLDAGYTVFGEVLDGIDIVESISEVKTDQRDRPVEDIIISIEPIN